MAIKTKENPPHQYLRGGKREEKYWQAIQNQPEQSQYLLKQDPNRSEQNLRPSRQNPNR